MPQPPKSYCGGGGVSCTLSTTGSATWLDATEPSENNTTSACQWCDSGYQVNPKHSPSAAQSFSKQQRHVRRSLRGIFGQPLLAVHGTDPQPAPKGPPFEALKLYQPVPTTVADVRCFEHYLHLENVPFPCRGFTGVGSVTFSFAHIPGSSDPAV